MMMDNRELNIVGEGDDNLIAAITLACNTVWDDDRDGYATHYSVVKLVPVDKKHPAPRDACWLKQVVDPKGVDTLILTDERYSEGGRDETRTKLPFNLNKKSIIGFVADWLVKADPGPCPDFDGDAHQGWRIMYPLYGHYHLQTNVVLVAQPVHALYGK